WRCRLPVPCRTSPRSDVDEAQADAEGFVYFGHALLVQLGHALFQPQLVDGANLFEQYNRVAVEVKTGARNLHVRRQLRLTNPAGDGRHDGRRTVAVSDVVLNHQHRARASLLRADDRVQVRQVNLAAPQPFPTYSPLRVSDESIPNSLASSRLMRAISTYPACSCLRSSARRRSCTYRCVASRMMPLRFRFSERAMASSSRTRSSGSKTSTRRFRIILHPTFCHVTPIHAESPADPERPQAPARPTSRPLRLIRLSPPALASAGRSPESA